MITSEELKKLLHYDPETGIFTWKVRRGGQAIVGAVAGSIDTSGYRQIKIHSRMYLAHRLAWLYIYNDWPKDQLDHINGLSDDNRLSNLREATQAENLQNSAKRSDNKCGYIGVCWSKSKNKWVAQIQTNKKKEHLGYFDTIELAYEAYCKAKTKQHKFQSIPRREDNVNNLPA